MQMETWCRDSFSKSKYTFWLPALDKSKNAKKKK